MRHTPGKRWRHIILNTHGTWLPADPRGFRNRDHRIHSTGDYRNRPPIGEHAGLHAYHLARSAPPVQLPRKCLPAIGEAIVQNLAGRQHSLAVIAVNPLHTHFLVELPDDVAKLKKIIGWCKFFATRAARDIEPALKSVELWAAGETYKPVDTASHFQAVVPYIATKQGADAWVWRDDSVTN